MIGIAIKGVRGLTVNEDFFKTWTRGSAWVYGWLLTDGSVQEKSGQVTIGLHSKDIDVLHKIKNLVEFSGNVYSSNRYGKQSSVLRICRKSMAEDLFALGMARTDKTFNTSMPDIPKTLFWDFIRGVFEGDGSISHRTGNTDALQVSICGATKKFIEDTQYALLSHGINTRMSQNNSGVYVIECRSNADALRMCYFMYANTTKEQRLDRKFDVYQNYVSTYYDKVKRRSKPCIQLVELARQTIPECADVLNDVREAV